MLDILTLLVAIIVPYFIIFCLVIPYSTGIHGDVVFDPNNYSEEPGGTFILPEKSGKYSGNITINKCIGWVFVDGKVRVSGSLTLKDAEFSYYKDFSEGGYRSSYAGELSIDGSDGYMEEGISIYLIGLIGSFFGFLIW